MFADGPLSFSGLNGEALRFASDASGQVTGVEGNGPFGPPIKATRVAP